MSVQEKLEELREWLINAEHDAWHDYKYSEDKTKRGNPFYEGYADAMTDAIAKLEELQND